MSRRANPGTRAVLNNRRRLKEIEREIAGLDTQREALLAERDERQAFNDLCERYANETPTDQLQPQAVGSAEQGNGAPSQGDGTLPPIAGPCSAEEQDAPRPLTGGEPSLGAVATGEAPPAGTGSRTPSRHEGPLTEGPGIDSGSSRAPARPDTEILGGFAGDCSGIKRGENQTQAGASSRPGGNAAPRESVTAGETAPYPEIPDNLRRQPNEAAE